VERELAQWLTSDLARPALAQASSEAEPESLAAAQRLRRDWTPEQSAAVLTQAALRRRARSKFGSKAAELFFTSDGLEQSTRGDVARWRAERFVQAGAKRIVDVGCGIGADALAFAEAGLEVVAIEADPVTAILAAANLAGRGRVVCGDATGQTDESAVGPLADELAVADTAVFVDPARRTGRGRTWRVADFAPPWDFATELLVGRLGCVKAAPGLPSGFIPEAVAATWVSHSGDLVETSLWSGIGEPGSRTAVLLPSRVELDAGARALPPVAVIGAYLYEPDPAVIRAGGMAALAELLAGWAVNPGIGYLSAERFVATPLAECFEVVEVLAYDERVLRAWVREHDIGSVEIKTRGIEVDPAELRRRLKPKGSAPATIVLTPTPAGARAVVVRRLRA
jgi:SAM-dependent methyltransferase